MEHQGPITGTQGGRQIRLAVSIAEGLLGVFGTHGDVLLGSGGEEHRPHPK